MHRFWFFLIIFAGITGNMWGTTPFVIFSPPKSGTFLCGKTLSLITEKTPAYHISGLPETTAAAIELIEKEAKANNFVVSHQFTAPVLKKLTAKGYKVIFIVRDIRDQVISIQNWLREGQWSWIPAAKIKDPVTQLTDLITGEITGWKAVESCFLKYENLLKVIPSQNVYITRFEKLVGEDGGSTDAAQLEEVIQLANFIEKPLGIDEAQQIAMQIFGGTKTFRKGMVGEWKTTFTKKQKKLFKDRYQGLLVRLGYEKDSNW